MRNKYDYFINNEKVTRKDFIKELESCCQKVVDTDVIAGWCGVDLMGLDKKKFRETMRDIEKGVTVMFFGRNKTFKRKVAI
jgi:hypothetical protein